MIELVAHSNRGDEVNGSNKAAGGFYTPEKICAARNCRRAPEFLRSSPSETSAAD
jgi:hypothetical protein